MSERKSTSLWVWFWIAMLIVTRLIAHNRMELELNKARWHVHDLQRRLGQLEQQVNQ
jgi:hypothetical protein